MPYTCETCGPLPPHDVIDVTDYDRPSGTVVEFRVCGQCSEPVKRC